MASDRTKLFLADLRVAPAAGGLDLRPSASGDLARAEGVDNIVQALTLRLLVRQGELAPLGRPDYGSRLHELVGERDTPRTRLKLMAYAREALVRDPRVVEVADLRAETAAGERGVVRLSATVRLVGHETPVSLWVKQSLEQP